MSGKHIGSDVKESIINLASKGVPRKDIATELGIKKSSVDYVLRPKQGEESSEKKSDSDSEELDHKAWSEYWKGRYLHAHAQLIENNIEPAPYE